MGRTFDPSGGVAGGGGGWGRLVSVTCVGVGQSLCDGYAELVVDSIQ